MLSCTRPHPTIPHKPHRSIDLQNAPAVSSAMRNLSLRPILSPFLAIHHHHRRVAAPKLSTFSADPIPRMEAKVEPDRGGSTETFDRNKKEEKEKEKTEKAIPPPPEKPEPGDCCGSGCVRCVWDVYYEELEDYNKMYETVADASGS